MCVCRSRVGVCRPRDGVCRPRVVVCRPRVVVCRPMVGVSRPKDVVCRSRAVVCRPMKEKERLGDTTATRAGTEKPNRQFERLNSGLKFWNINSQKLSLCCHRNGHGRSIEKLTVNCVQ